MIIQTRTWTPLWPLVEPHIINAQPNGRMPKPNADGWIGNLRSPLHKDQHPSFSVKPDSPTDPGSFKDHATGDSGPISELARRLNIDPRQSASAVAPAQPSVLTLAEFCAQRKLDQAHLTQAWGVTETKWSGRPALRYRTTLGIDRIKYLDGAKPKYGWVRSGGTAHWYGLQQALALGGPLLYLVNGEISVWACHQEGVAAICVAAGEGTLPTPEMMAELIAGSVTDIAVVYDRDTKGDEGAIKMADALKGYGINATAHELPAHLGEHGDVDDLHRWEGAKLGQALAALPILQPTPPPAAPRRWLTEEEHDQLPPGEYLLDQEIPADGLTVLYGPSGSGKTFVALDYGMRIAQSRPVMVVPAEDSAGWALRRRAWRGFHQNTDGTVYTWPEEVNLMNPAGDVDTFIEQTRNLDLGFIIFDTLHQSMVGADENSSRDMGIVIQSCKRIQRETGAAVMLVHHTGKNGSSERGSSALRGAAHTMIELSNEDGLIRLRCEKAKNSAPFGDRFMRLFETGGSCVALPAESVLVTKAATLSKMQRDVLEMLNLDVFENTGAKSSDIVKATHSPEGTIWRTLSTLKRHGFVSQSIKGDPYYITEAGKRKLQEGTLNANTAHQQAEPSHLSPSLNNSHESSSQPSHSTLSHSHTPIGVRDERSSESDQELKGEGKPKPPITLRTPVNLWIADAEDGDPGALQKAVTRIQAHPEYDWSEQQSRVDALSVVPT